MTSWQLALGSMAEVVCGAGGGYDGNDRTTTPEATLVASAGLVRRQEPVAAAAAMDLTRQLVGAALQRRRPFA